MKKLTRLWKTRHSEIHRISLLLISKRMRECCCNNDTLVKVLIFYELRSIDFNNNFDSFWIEIIKIRVVCIFPITIIISDKFRYD